MGMEKVHSINSGQARLNLKISGRVQGVFFRAETARKARSLGLVGWVRNAPDGTVEVVAEGEKEALERLYAWCQKGSSFAQVEKVEAEWESYQGEFKKFGVTY